MTQSEDPSVHKPSKDALKFEVSQGRDSTLGGRRTESGSQVAFRAWFEQIHWIVVMVVLGWGACLAIVALSTEYYQSTETRISTSYIALIMGSLSLIGAGLLLLSGFVHHLHGKALPPSFHLVYATASADILLAVHFVLSSILTLAGERPEGAMCYFISFLAQVGGVGSASWTAVICINLLCILIEPVTYGRRQAEYFPYYHAGVWTINVVVWIAAAATGGVGMSVIDTCWMQGTWALVSVLMTTITTLVIAVLVGFCLVKAYLYPNMRSTLFNLVKQCILLGVCYVMIIFVFTWVSVSVSVNGEVSVWLAHLESFAVPSLGLMNFLIWFGFVKRGLSMLAHRHDSATNSSHGAGTSAGNNLRATATKAGHGSSTNDVSLADVYTATAEPV